VPDQPPDATHSAALLLDQVSVDAAPAFTVLGLALKATAGGGVLTVMTTDCEALPPPPLQIN
jgi:hypothetical protein